VPSSGFTEGKCDETGLAIHRKKRLGGKILQGKNADFKGDIFFWEMEISRRILC
jgi:hypothetical protein